MGIILFITHHFQNVATFLDLSALDQKLTTMKMSDLVY